MIREGLTSQEWTILNAQFQRGEIKDIVAEARALRVNPDILKAAFAEKTEKPKKKGEVIDNGD